jgi:hypothetical protein
VQLLLGSLLLAVCAFVLLLSYFNLSPAAFLNKVAHRFLTQDANPQPLVRDAPYRRLTVASHFLHRPQLLNLETSDGSGQACHPDVVYIPQGFGLNKWPYWMVCTPYPYLDSYRENPEVFVSCDGLTWCIPKGLQNPVVHPPRMRGDHNSDPDILFHENELWLFYRETVRSQSPNENTIFLVKSSDGVRWSAPIEILQEKSGAELLSPAVCFDRDHFAMWTIEILGGELKLMRRTSLDGLIWGAPVLATVMGLEKGRHPWHIDVIQEEDRLSALLVSCTGLGGRGARIHYAFSEDHGLTWSAGGILLQQIYEFEANTQYRATFRRLGGTPAIYEVWYSASSSTNMFSIAYLKLARTENSLQPCDWLPGGGQTLTSAK